MSIFTRFETNLVNLYSALSRRRENWKLVREVNGARIWCAADKETRDANFKGVAGFAVGEDIYVPKRADAHKESLIRHEMTHVNQQRRWGILFPVMYWAEHARVGYEANIFEKEARAAERPPRRRVRSSGSPICSRSNWPYGL